MRHEHLSVVLLSLTGCIADLPPNESVADEDGVAARGTGPVTLLYAAESRSLRLPTASAIGDGVVVVESAAASNPVDRLLHFDADGQQTWSVELPWTVAAMAALPDGDYVISAQQAEAADRDGLLVRVSDDGTLGPPIRLSGHEELPMLDDALVVGPSSVYVATEGPVTFCRLDLDLVLQTCTTNDDVDAFALGESGPLPIAVNAQDELVLRSGSNDAPGVLHTLRPDGSFADPIARPSFDLAASPEHEIVLVDADPWTMEPLGGGEAQAIAPFAHLVYGEGDVEFGWGDSREVYWTFGAHLTVVFARTDALAPDAYPYGSIVAEIAEDGTVVREVEVDSTFAIGSDGARPWMTPKGATAGPDGTIYLVNTESQFVDDGSYERVQRGTLHMVGPG